VGQKNKGDRVTITEEAEGGSYRWGKMEDGNWICLDYVRYDTDVRKVTGITLLHPPEKTEYVQKSENLKLDGSVLMLHYEDGTASAMTLTAGMISGFTNDTLGEVTVQVNYGGYTASFTVTIIKATVTFRSGDGAVISSAQYAYGETVIAPEEVLPWEYDEKYYVFNGWDKEVTPCNGNAVYTATYIESERPEQIPQSMTSEVYTLVEGYIRKIPLGTTVEALLSGINEKDYVAVYAGGEPVASDAMVSTGMTVNLEHKGNVIQSVTVIVTGDVNGDGEISITDMINMKSHILEKTALTDAYAQAADLNGDGAVSITDFVQIKAFLLGNGNITEN
jgi:hypothetical protein